MGDTQAESLPVNTVAQAALTPAFIEHFLLPLFPARWEGQEVDRIITQTIDDRLSIAELAQTLVLSNMFWNALICNKLPMGPTNPWQMQFSFVIIVLLPEGLESQSRECGVVRCHRHLFPKSISSLAQLAATIYLVADTGDMLDPESFRPGSTNYWLQCLALKLSLAFLGNIMCDGTVAGSLTYYFRSYRTGMPRTEPVMQQLILLSTSTGLLLCLLTASAWALAQIDPYHSSNCLVPLFIVGKLYVNSMMANLNSRRHFRTVVERTIDYSMHASAFDTSRLATE
ncbi:hypothetical protein FIBSPDRAFT_1013449 [Athelia psychrophila]|uniref:DUF6534 domain-containing protein n=1 Tax=Athelia psychrophila TaxID=1759441 RepID=A0A166MIX0_9AGAM|nr:hypothetical protein FIBSPDRAFT_1013449 [Fibularhizoctonia sp. CBS 109695]